MSWLLLLLACAPAPGTPERDRARQFSALLAAGDAARCAELEAAEWRGHCENALGMPCEQIVPSPWQEECYFARAEADGARSEGARLEDCVRSGAFAQECLTHLFKAALKPTLSAAPARPDVAGMTADAAALADRWAADAGPWSPPWGWWWRRLHQASTPVDRAVCAPLDRAHRAHCQRGAFTILRDAWRRGAPEHPELCGLSLEEVRAQVADDPELAWAPNPDLDELVRLALARSC